MGAAAAGGAGAVGAAGAGAAAPPDSMNARMSFLVTRPPWPVPWTAPTSTPCSAAMRATTGETKVLPFRCRLPATPASGAGAAGTAAALGARQAGARRSGAAAGSGSGAGCGDFGGRRGALGRDLRELRPDVDRLALLDEDLLTTPVPGLGTSVSTLSVEISSSVSSASIVSPSFLSHLTIVPSETETPICGMTTSMIVPVAIQ